MLTLQEDLLGIYNSLVGFSKKTLDARFPQLIKVRFDEGALVFEQEGTLVRLSTPLYYSLGLNELIKETYLLPENYYYLMRTLSDLIKGGKLLDERVCLSPEDFGFDLYLVNQAAFSEGPQVIGKVRFISGYSWWFRFKTRRKWKLK